MHKYDNRVTVTLDGLSANVSFARVAASAFIMPLDPNVEELNDIKTAVSEAVTNAIIHGYASQDSNNIPGEVTMTMTSTDRVISITITDYGIGIENISQARALMFTTKPELERSGLGFTVMESCVDMVNIDSEPGRGTIITLTKKLADK